MAPTPVTSSTRRFVLAALAVFAIFALPASGGASQPLGSWQGGYQYSPWIAQQQYWLGSMPTDGTAIINPFGSSCFWSVNDHASYISFGYLEPNAVVTDRKCVVSDYGPTAPYGFATAYLKTKSASITLRVCYQPQGRCFETTPRYDSGERAYVSTFCGRAHYGKQDLVEIPGSNGGYGLITTVTTTITNNSSRRVRDLFVRVGYASDIAVFMGWEDAIGCLPMIPYVDHFEYPFEWTHS